jgi:hypothetical protein
MKKASIVFLVSCAVFLALVFACETIPVNRGGGEMKVNADEGSGGGSTIAMAPETLEGLDGYSFTGRIDKKKYQYGYVNAKLYPDEETLALLKEAKAVSFRFLGEGGKYIISIATTDVKDNAWFEYVYETQAGVPQTVIVPIEYFMQPSWGKTIAAMVDLSNTTFVQWMYNDSEGPYTFKLWDFRVHTGSVPTPEQIAPAASVAMKAAPPPPQPVGGSLTNVVWEVQDNFQYADGYIIYFADPRVFNGNKVTKGDSYTFKFTCTPSRDLENEMRIALVDHLASNGHTVLADYITVPGSKMKAGVPFSAEIKFEAKTSATGVRPMANTICMETKGTQRAGKFSITFSEFVFTKN